MDIKERQLWSREQEVVLAALASAAGCPGPRFLEVGSWCGDSTVVLARVAQRLGGTLICVDWWRGNVGTELSEIARRVDIFREFWRRIQGEGLDDVVLPLRARSEVAAHALRSGAFDMVFLDGDHRYSSVSCDIREYSRLVRSGGILCGHDCEGRLDDYDRDFLEDGREIDCHESVHCGVVMAVGEHFSEFALDHGMWSVIRGQGSSWKPTNLAYPGLQHFSQGPVPPIASSTNWQVFRFGRSVYAVPRQMIHADVRLAETRTDRNVLRATRLAHLETQLAEPIVAGWTAPALPGSGEAADGAVERAADEFLNGTLQGVPLETQIAVCRNEIAWLDSELTRVSSTAEATAAALSEARSASHALERAGAERESRIDSLRAACDEAHRLAAVLQQQFEDERLARNEALTDFARSEARLEQITKELSHARIDLELLRLGVADADWTSAVLSVESAKD